MNNKSAKITDQISKHAHKHFKKNKNLSSHVEQYTEIQKWWLQETNKIDLSQIIQKAILNNKELFQAFLHTSFSHEFFFDSLCNNERLEFLGDAILALIISTEIFNRYEMMDEGKMSQFRSNLIDEKSLHRLALMFKFDQLILVGQGVLKQNGHQLPSMLSSCFEAYIGIYYHQNGYDKTKKHFLKLIDEQDKENDEYFSLKKVGASAKNLIQEFGLKKYGKLPTYKELRKSSRSDNNQSSKNGTISIKKKIKSRASKEVVYGLYIGNKIFSKGIGPNKKEATRDAAEKYLKVIEKTIDVPDKSLG